MNEVEKQIESKWWDPRTRGTLASFAAKTAVVGVMLGFVGDRVVDQSHGAVDSIVEDKTEQIREDFEEPIAEVTRNSEEAKDIISVKADELDDALVTISEAIQTIDGVRLWLEQDMGVDFNEQESQK